MSKTVSDPLDFRIPAKAMAACVGRLYQLKVQDYHNNSELPAYFYYTVRVILPLNYGTIDELLNKLRS